LRKVAVEHGSAPGWAFLRELRGDDEEAVGATDSEAAIALLDRLLVGHAGSVVGPGRACELSISDRDRLLAAVQVAELGARIESTVRCGACEKPFDIDFDLVALMDTIRDASPSVSATREADGVYRTADGRRFRLPRGIEERTVAALAPSDAERALLEACLLDRDASNDLGDLSETMRAIGPLLDAEIGATCAECGHSQTVRFDLQHYFLSELVDGRKQRAREVHRIAMAYRWSLSEILSLSRAQRRMHVDLIEREGALG